MGLQRVEKNVSIQVKQIWIRFLLDFVNQKLQPTLRPLRGQGKIGEAGLGQGEHRDHEVQVGEKAQGDDASDAAQISL